MAPAALSAGARLSGVASSSPARPREGATGYACLAVECLFRLGLRFGECLGIRNCDLDFEAGILHVRHSWGQDNRLGPTKTSSSERRIPIPESLLSKLAARSLELDADDETFLFAWRKGMNPPSQTNFRRRAWEPAIEKVGLPDRPKATPHSARHALASQLSFNGASSNDLMRLLGHSTIRTTEQTYVHLFGRTEQEERIRQAMEQAAA